MSTDKITTIVGGLIAALAAGNEAVAAFNGQKVNWVVVAGAVLMAAFSYYTNKQKKA